MLQYGSNPQRAKLPWFSDATAIDAAMVLPDQVCGPKSELVAFSDPPARCLVAAHEPFALLDGLSPTFAAPPGDDTFWSVHIDGALNTDRSGDRAGIAMGRISHTEVETGEDALERRYSRVVRTFEIALAAQIAAPQGHQIDLGSLIRFVLQLKQNRGFNITSVSMDGFQSSLMLQEFAWAGIVTAGMRVEDNGEITGIPKAFSVDRTPQPYTELLVGINERRVFLPRYAILRTELRGLEHPVTPGNAPNHALGGSKDVADAVGGLTGYLAAHGHAELLTDDQRVYTREDFERELGWEEPVSFGPEASEWASDYGPDDNEVAFGLE